MLYSFLYAGIETMNRKTRNPAPPLHFVWILVPEGYLIRE